MSRAVVRDLADCTAFRVTLQSRPPRLVHATALLLVGLLAAGITWLAVTDANLVVKASGRMRPLATPTKVFSATYASPTAGQGGRQITEIKFREGDEVKKGDVLVRLETQRLETEMAKRRRALAAAEEELGQLTKLLELLDQQHAAARAKAEAEVDRAVKDVEQEREDKKKDAEVALADLRVAEDEVNRYRALATKQVIPEGEVVKAVGREQAAREKLAKAKLPVNEGRIDVARQALAGVGKEFAVRKGEVDLKRGLKQGEVDALKLDLKNLDLDLSQSALLAPIDGVVTAGDLKAGDVLEPGKPVAEVAGQDGLLFEAWVASADVGKLRVGLPTRIKLNAFDYQKYGTVEGTVTYIAPDSTVTKEQPAPMYMVRIAVDAREVGRGEYRGVIKLGMSGQVEIVTDRESLLSVLTRTVKQSISLD